MSVCRAPMPCAPGSTSGRPTLSLAVATGRKLREAGEILAGKSGARSPVVFLASLAVAPAIQTTPYHFRPPPFLSHHVKDGLGGGRHCCAGTRTRGLRLPDPSGP
jgi:hypothetical protein